jgi:WD40 repeat protein
MAFLSNENIIKLVYDNFLITLRLFSIAKNKIISNVILRAIDYNKIYKTIGKSQHLLDNMGYHRTITLLPNDTIIVPNESKLKVFDINTTYCIQTVYSPEIIQSIVSLPDNKIAICTYLNIIIYDTSLNFTPIKVISLPKKCYCFEKLFVLSNGDLASIIYLHQYSIVIYDQSSDYNKLKVLNPEYDHLMCIVSVSNNRVAVSTYEIRTINIFDVAGDYKCLNKLYGYESSINDLLFIPQSNVLVSGAADGSIMIWSMDDNIYLINRIFTHQAISCLLLLKNGFFATGGYNGIEIYNWVYFKVIKQVSGFSTKYLKQMKDDRIVSATGDGEVIILGL